MFIRTNSRWVTTIAAAMAVALSAAAVAQTVPRFSSEPTRLGEVTGDPEKDTSAYVVVGHERCGSVPRFSATPSWIGEATGDAEKDTFGFVVLEYGSGCPALAGSGTVLR